MVSLPLDREQTTKIMRNEADLQRLLHEVFKEEKKIGAKNGKKTK